VANRQNKTKDRQKEIKFSTYACLLRGFLEARERRGWEKREKRGP